MGGPAKCDLDAVRARSGSECRVSDLEDNSGKMKVGCSVRMQDKEIGLRKAEAGEERRGERGREERQTASAFCLPQQPSDRTIRPSFVLVAILLCFAWAWVLFFLIIYIFLFFGSYCPTSTDFSFLKLHLVPAVSRMKRSCSGDYRGSHMYDA